MDAQGSNGLIISQDSSRGSDFPNQGQIDWVALANTTVSASVGFLSRMSNAGVDPFTVAVGQAVASKFQISRLGHHRLESALKNLQCVSGVSETLWFGFGINHIIRSLSETTEGATCIMLCSALSETRSTALSARVLFDLANTYSPTNPEATRLTPSLQQWEALVKVSAGCLFSTSFGTVVDQMVSLIHSHKSLSLQKDHRPLIGKPKDVALVLHQLGKLSMSRLTTLTISGGCDCGWIAAVAYWFFDIAVEVRDAKGQTIYPTPKSTATLHRTLAIVQASKNSNALQTIGEAYRIADITHSIIVRDEPDNMRHNINNLLSRLPWESALRQAFGKYFSTLLRLKTDFGIAVGSAARMFAEFVKPQTSVCDLLELSPGLILWYAYSTASCGQGFIYLLTTRFPETASLRDIMDDASRVSFSDAVAAYQTAHERLASACKCLNCKNPGTGPAPHEAQPPCLVVLCVLVIRLALDLSVTSVALSLLPSRSGLQESYLACLQMMKHQPGTDSASKLFGSMDFDNAMDSMSTLFTGTRNSDSLSSGRRPLAFVSHGLCTYRGVLRNLTDKPEEMASIYIIPGRIETRTGRAHDSLMDTAQFRTPVFNYSSSPAIPCSKLPTSPHDLSEEHFEVLAVVEENVSALTTHFVVTKDSERSLICCPSLFLSRLLEACGNGRVLCSRRNCPDLDISGLSVATIEGVGHFRDESFGVSGCRIGLRLVGRNPVARMMALLVDKLDLAEEIGRSQEASNEYSENDQNLGISLSRSNINGSVLREAEAVEPDWVSNATEAPPPRSMSTSQHSSDELSPFRFRSRPQFIMQRGECLPCIIRTAIQLSQERNAYIVCG